MSPRPDPVAAPKPRSGRCCATCDRSEWEGFRRWCLEWFELHGPADPACGHYDDFEAKRWL